MILAEGVQQFGTQPDARIQQGVRPRSVSAELDQILRVPVRGKRLAHLASDIFLLEGGDRRRQAGDLMKYIDSEIVSLGRELARQDSMSVGNRANPVRDRLIEIVALHEHRKKPGDRASRKIPGASKNFGQNIGYGGCVPFLAGWFTGRQADLSLGR